MPPVVVTYLGFPFLLALLVFVHLLVRNLSGRALGVRETRTPLPRLLATAAGPLASYLTCALFFLVAFLGSGRQERSLRVSVTPSGPAYEAGLRDGDRVVAMNGTHLSSWDELRAMIQDNGDPPIDMQVERGGQTLHFNVQPRDGRIDVAAIIERHELPLGFAAATAMAAPVFSIADRVRELTEPRPLMGPVAIIEREPSPWPLLFRFGVLASYAWPFSMLTAFVVSRASRPLRSTASTFVAILTVSCMAPGGILSGRVATDTGDPIPNARVDVDFRDGTSFDVTPQESGEYFTMWSHGSWRNAIVRASAPGMQAAEAAIGWDSWACDFILAREDASPSSSKATCIKVYDK